MGFKGKSNSQPKHIRDMKCFRYQGLIHYALECPNKRIMVIRDNGDVESKSNKSDCKDPLKDCTKDELTLSI